jgi:hypothetical protein
MRSILFFVFSTICSLVFSQRFTPESYFGYKLGTQFTPQYQVVNYYNALQSNFPTNVKIEKYGKTNENRDLILVYIGTAENIAKLEQNSSQRIHYRTFWHFL